MLRSLALYTSLVFAANAAIAGPVDWQAARDAGLPKLIESKVAPAPQVEFTDVEGATHTLADWKGKVVLLNFWATWCRPCTMMAPVLDELAGSESEKLTVAKVDVEANQELAAEYQITAIPAFKGLDGRFDRARYADALKREGLREAEFEHDLRMDEARQILQGGGQRAASGEGDAGREQ